jgi:hypothetical protein
MQWKRETSLAWVEAQHRHGELRRPLVAGTLLVALAGLGESRADLVDALAEDVEQLVDEHGDLEMRCLGLGRMRRAGWLGRS